ncbi:uncharacterized protein LOC124943795 [Impatiens glandulifera]|uniref:uncharacterized protein LOC124943795 n=1 Tax=Impatiens glandulifera TaxID=253017 RepID=UPI001FB16D2B|nr:uncharacterized protein LOC124943795 [Impatiens glandulifera]
MQGSNVCFLCKQRGHIQRDYPKKNEVAPGRVFSTREEADPKTTIITGNLLIANILANTLIDTEATHSFITACFVQKAGLKPEESLMAYSISLPSGSHLNSNKIIKACPVYNQNHKMLAYLVVVDMVGFDVILGMDWLFRYEAQINCNKKTVVLTDQYGKTFLFRAIPTFKRHQLFLERATRGCLIILL